MSAPLPPKPFADRDTQPFWDAAAGRRLVVQRCDACEKWIWQPKPMCPRCHSSSVSWREMSGRARVVSWTVIHPPVLPVWADEVPFVIVLAELDDAPSVRILGQLVSRDGGLLQTDGAREGIDFDARVRIAWRLDEAGTTLPAWTLETD